MVYNLTLLFGTEESFLFFFPRVCSLGAVVKVKKGCSKSAAVLKFWVSHRPVCPALGRKLLYKFVLKNAILQASGWLQATAPLYRQQMFYNKIHSTRSLSSFVKLIIFFFWWWFLQNLKYLWFSSWYLISIILHCP